MKIYLVNGVDELYDRNASDTITLKAFKDQDKAQDFLADCGFAFEQWDKECPEDTDNEEEWHQFCLKHPFYNNGHMPTAFELVEVEFEE